jgi:predicted TIM-barrel fold metal-dependent hydrolase
MPMVADPRSEAVIDCDVHCVVADIGILEPYLSAHWREVVATSQFKGPTDSPYPPSLPTSQDPELEPVGGHAPATSVETVRAHVLDAQRVEIAILSCAYGVDSVRNPDAAAALSAAVNDWQAAEWLQPEPRLRGSIAVPSQPAMAAEEIARAAHSHPGFVQVHLPVRSAVPYGNRIWWPLFEAAVEHDLVVSLHFGGAPGLPPTASGWPTYYVEEVVGMASAFQSQLTSLVAEGTFDKFPALRVALVEAGYAWLPAFLWRFDKGWRGLRREVPWTKRPPSEYVREHVRLTLQPIDGPPDAEQMRTVLEWLDFDELLLYSSDYPHRTHAEGRPPLPAGLPERLAGKILADNARRFYRLGDGST